MCEGDLFWNKAGGAAEERYIMLAVFIRNYMNDI
jgi:hypothetical protein